jgi:hypothetical protein
VSRGLINVLPAAERVTPFDRRETGKEELMSEQLYRLLLEHETDLVNEVQRELMHSTARHYRDLEWETLLRRVEGMTAHLLMSLRETPVLFVDYITEIATRRIEEGCGVDEILMAMRILEERVWPIVEQGVPLTELARALAQVTGTIGAAKDQVAVIYVEQAKQRRNAS